MTSLLSGGGGAFIRTKTEVEFSHDERPPPSPPQKANFVMTKLNFSFGPDERPPPPDSKLVMTKL